MSTDTRGDRDTRTVLSLIGAVAVVAIVTGLVAMVTEPIFTRRGTVGAVQAVSPFGAVLVGFALLVTGWGIRRGFRLAYLAAVVLLAFTALDGVAQSRLVSVPLTVLSLVALALLVRKRRRRAFTRPFSLSEPQIGALLAIGGVLAYGTVGSFVLRAEIDGVDSLLDGLYFTFVTASTVGYGDVYATTTTGRLFAISLIVLGPVSVLAVAGTLFAPVVESSLTRAGARATRGDRVDFQESMLLLGEPDPGDTLVDALADRAPLAVVTTDETWAERLESRDVDVGVGDPTDETVLDRAFRSEPTTVVVATDPDIAPEAVLAADRADARVRIVAITTGENETDLVRSGADVTIDPAAALAGATVDAAVGIEPRPIR